MRLPFDSIPDSSSGMSPMLTTSRTRAMAKLIYPIPTWESFR